MNAWRAVFERELWGRRFFALAGLLLGLLPLGMPLVARHSAGEGPEVRVASALYLLGWFAGPALALLLGVEMIRPELREGRLGFYLARPIPAWALWAGKAASSLLVCAATLALVVLPAMVARGGAAVLAEMVESLGPGPWRILLLLAGLPLLLFALGAVLALLESGRSAWSLAAVLLLLGAGWVLLAAAGRLSRLAAPDPTTVPLVLRYGAAVNALLVLVPVLALGLLAAAGAAVAGGRLDPRRRVRLLTLALLAVLAPVALGGDLYSRWALDVHPADLVRVSRAVAAPRGPWAAIRGPAWGRGGYAPTFLIDTRGGAYLGVGEPAWSLTFSATGRHAAWLEIGDGSPSRPELVVAHLAGPGRVERTGLFLPPSTFALSPEGERVAVLQGDLTLAVHDLAERRLLASARLSEGILGLRFVDADHLRVYSTLWREGERVLEIGELEVTTGALTPTGRIRGLAGLYRTRADAAGDRLLGHREDGWTVLYDGRGGEPLAALAALGRDGEGGAAFLSTDSSDPGRDRVEGGVVLAVVEEGEARLRLFTAAGEPAGALPLGPAEAVRFAGEPAPGELLVVLEPGGRLLRVRPGWGRAELVARGVEPVQSEILGFHLPILASQPEIGLFYHPDGTLLALGREDDAPRPAMPGR